MWILYRCIFSALVFYFGFILISAPVSAQESKPKSAPEPTRVEADSEASEIRFYIDGDVAAVLKSDGLHVRKRVFYGGALTDYGQQGFDGFTGNAEPAATPEKDGADAQ